MSSSSSKILFFNINLILTLYFSDGTELIIVNNCKETIWPGLLGTAGHQPPKSGGFRLGSGEAQTLELPENWSGRVWPRTGCCFDDGVGGCETGDCGGLLHCSGLGGEPPATTVEMTLGTPESAVRFYDVSLVGGFNVPASMVAAGPSGGGIYCGTAACEADVNEVCPAALAVRGGGGGGRVVGCRSECMAAAVAGSPELDRICCRGEFSRAEKCRPTVVGRVFKAVCPRAYSYAFDEATGLMTCMADRYVITFCPPTY